MLRFDPEDQAVLSPALNTAFVFPADTGDGYPSPGTSVGPDLSGFLLDLPLGEGVSWHCHLAGASGTNALWGGKGTVMNVLHTRWRALVLALLLAVSLAVPAAAAEPRDRRGGPADHLADTAASYAAQYGGAQSLQYALWQDGEIVLTGQTGTFSRSENRLMTGDELYGIGSVSKIYTTVAVMQLAEDGKVSLDAPVTQYLPDFKMADERYKDITVRMLLNHSSGILGTGLSDAMLFGEASTRAHDTPAGEALHPAAGGGPRRLQRLLQRRLLPGGAGGGGHH